MRSTRIKVGTVFSTWFESPHVYGCKVTETDLLLR
jgi:hypothetical protein